MFGVPLALLSIYVCMGRRVALTPVYVAASFIGIQLAYALAYAAADAANPDGAFATPFPRASVGSSAHFIEFLHFSALTMTAIGSSGLDPLSPAMKLLHSSQALVSTLFFAVFLHYSLFAVVRREQHFRQ